MKGKRNKLIKAISLCFFIALFAVNLKISFKDNSNLESMLSLNNIELSLFEGIQAREPDPPGCRYYGCDEGWSQCIYMIGHGWCTYKEWY